MFTIIFILLKLTIFGIIWTFKVLGTMFVYTSATVGGIAKGMDDK